jgi:error-prone DNA polymerase
MTPWTFSSAVRGLTLHRRIECLMSLCDRMQNLLWHLGQHSGGMIVCAGMLDEVVPLEPHPGRTVCQRDKDGVESLRLIKLTCWNRAHWERFGIAWNSSVSTMAKKWTCHTLPEGPAVYDAIVAADTVGLFQIESCAQMASLLTFMSHTRVNVCPGALSTETKAL